MKKLNVLVLLAALFFTTSANAVVCWGMPWCPPAPPPPTPSAPPPAADHKPSHHPGAGWTFVGCMATTAVYRGIKNEKEILRVRDAVRCGAAAAGVYFIGGWQGGLAGLAVFYVMDHIIHYDGEKHGGYAWIMANQN